MKKLYFSLFESFRTQVSITLILLIGIRVAHHNNVISLENLLKNLEPLHSSLASIYGSLLGFVITAAAIVISLLSSDRLSIVRQSPHFPKLWQIFFSAAKVLGIATIFSLICLINGADMWLGDSAVYFIFGIGTLSVLRVISCLWVLENVVELHK